MGADVRSENLAARSLRAARQLSDRTPLRTKLITAVLALVIMALVAISIASFAMLNSYLTTQHDGRLQAAMFQISNGGNLPLAGYAEPYSQGSDIIVAIEASGGQLAWPHSIFPNYARSSEPLPKLPAGTGWANSADGVLLTVPAQTGPNSWRLLAETILDPVDSSANEVLIVAVPLGNINAVTNRLALFDLIVGGAIVVVLAAVGIAIVQANLRPLNDIEMTAGQIARGHLGHRIPERDPRTEIGGLGQSLNTMLSQIETAFHARERSERAAHQSEERMRRFIADASHELRTPLTTIRGFAEYYRQRGGVSKNVARMASGSPVQANDSSAEWPDGPGGPGGPGPGPGPGGDGPGVGGPGGDGLTPEDLDRIMRRLESEAARMGVLVEDLLLLARLDQQRPLDTRPVDLLTLAADAVQDARMVAPDRKIDLLVAPGAAFLVNGDEARLRQVIGNLVNNALTHTPPGTAVRLRIASGTLTPPDGSPRAGADDAGAGDTGDARAGAGRAGVDAGSAGAGDGRGGRPVPAVVLDVEDDGPGMSAEQAQRVFERFYRADLARTRISGGTGLGLAIVAGLVAAHGGTVSVRTAPGKGANFQVRLPLSPEASYEEDTADFADGPDVADPADAADTADTADTADVTDAVDMTDAVDVTDVTDIVGTAEPAGRDSPARLAS
jgi:two-component system OmpR family sensor kinase